jgi:hypothetical protein
VSRLPRSFPIDRAQRLLARWVKDGLIAELPAVHSAKAETVSAAARKLLPAPEGPTATDVLLQMRADERA